jgi:uncharacterized DUF497 family protein
MATFEWDPEKADANLEKHKIDFVDAVVVFDGPHFTYASPREDELRFVSVGYVEQIAIAVVWTERGTDVRRVISARRARREEREAYRQSVGH